MRRLSLFSSIEWALRQRRRLRALMAPKPVLVVVEAPPVVAEEPVVVVPEPPPVVLHALDPCPVFSKIVVVKDQGETVAILALPSGEQVILGADDPASKLPIGAKIQKTAGGEFVSSQLGGGDACRVSETATDAIDGFTAFFHPGE